MTMTLRLLRVIAPLVAVAVAASALAACSTGDPPGQPPPSLGDPIERPVPAAVRSLVFTTSTGAQVSLAALHGKVVVLTDFLTLCGEECPMTSANMNQMARAAAKDGFGDKVVFVEVTVDPQRDTPARMAAYREMFGAADDWLLVTTTPSNLKAFCQFFGIFYEKTKEGNPPDTDWLTGKPLTYDVAHQDAVVFLDSSGSERFVILGNANTQGSAPPPTLASFLDEQGQQNLASPGPMSWTVPGGLRVVSWLLGKDVRT